MKPKLVAAKLSELVILAVHDLETNNNRNRGFTVNEVTKYISAKYKVDSDRIKPTVKSALARGLTFGIFSELNNRYRLEEVPKPPLNVDEKTTEAPKGAAKKKNPPSKKRKMTKKRVKGKKCESNPTDEESICGECCQRVESRAKTCNAECSNDDVSSSEDDNIECAAEQSGTSSVSSHQ